MVDCSVSYQLYTISDIEQWLIHNVENGLSDKVISRSRALAFIRNPHAKQKDVALSVVYDEHRVAVGYTGAFAEEWCKPDMKSRYFWGSTQWMDPRFRGKGMSGKMMRMIKDAVEDKYVALDSSPASCRLDEKQGSVISYYPRYFIVLKGKGNSIKSVVKNVLSLFSIKKALQNMENYRFINRYVSIIDDETYSFIVAHSEKDLFLRKHDFLNWQVRYPFMVQTGGDKKKEVEKCEFGGYVNNQQTNMIQVFVNGKMCGFYVLKIIDSICSTWYLYYDDAFREEVFASLSLNVLKNKNVSRVQTFNKDLYDFMKLKGVKSQFSKIYKDQISLTIPSGFVINASLHLQGGDGDMFC